MPRLVGGLGSRTADIRCRISLHHRRHWHVLHRGRTCLQSPRPLGFDRSSISNHGRTRRQKRVASPGYLAPGACTWWAPRVSHRSLPAATSDGNPAGIAYPNITIQRTGRRAAFFHNVIPSCLTDSSSRFKFGRFSVIALTGSRRVSLRTL